MFAYMNGWLIFVVDVGKYTMTMDPMGKKDGEYIGATEGSGIFFVVGGIWKCKLRTKTLLDML